MTSLLHYKEETNSITIENLEVLFKSILKDKQNLSLLNSKEKVINKVFEVADSILKDKSDKLDLEKKICLSIAIRLKAEIFMVKSINDDIFWKGITKNQFDMLIKEYKKRFSLEITNIQLLEQVNLMTPENIHINSFMYEPILDISNHHIKKLYQDIKGL